MANLENLNFAVILDDSKFTSQIKKVQDAADRFNTSMTDALKVTTIAGGTASVRELAKALTEAKEAQLAFNKAIKASPGEKVFVNHANAVTATNAKLNNTAKLLRTLSTLTGGAFSIYGLRRFLSTLIDVTGQFEVQKMALRTILQDIDAADKIFQDLYRFSSDSTYRFSELAKYSKQLAAFNIGKESLLDTTKMLGDVASGVGVSMDRLILAYGHVKSSGFLRGIQLRSFSQNGVPVLDELARMLTEIEGKAVSLGDVFDRMTRREISFDMVEQAFKNMTSEGGKFYKMQEVLSKTLAGQINILKGRWENLMYAIGQSQDGLLKGTVSSISNIIANYEEMGKLLAQIIIAFGAYKTSLIAIEMATKTFAIANHRLLNSFYNIGKWISANPYAILAAGIATVTFAIIRQYSALSDVEKIQGALTKAQNDYNSTLGAEIGELDALYAKLKMAEKGTKDYDIAKRTIESRFGTYINQLRQEGVAVNDLSVLYNDLADKIRDANKERFMEQATADLGTSFNNARSSAEAQLKGLIASMENESRKLTANEKEALWQFVNGSGDMAAVNGALLGMDDILKMRRGGKNVGRNATSGQFYMAAQASDNTFENELDKIRSLFKDAKDTYATAMTEAQEAFAVMTGAKSDGDGLDNMTYKIADIIKNIKDLDAEIASIRNKASRSSITVAEKENLDSLVKQREEEAKSYKEIMGVDYDKGVRAGGTAAQKAIRDEIQVLNKRAAILRKYKDVYDSLRPYLGEEQTGSALGILFGGNIGDTDFDTQLDRIIVKLSELGEEGQQAAESLRSALGKETGQDIKKSLEAQDKTTEMLRDYLAKDFGIEGEGVAAKISKVLVDLTNKNLKADKDLEEFIEELDKAEAAKKLEYLAAKSGWFDQFGYDDKRREAAANAYWQNWRKQQIDAWKERLKLEKEANKKLSNEQIVNLADDYFKSFTGGIDLTNFNDKSIAQLRAMRTELLKMNIPTSVVDMLDADTLERFSDVLDKMQGDALNKINIVLSEKRVQSAQKLFNAFNGIGAALTEMGEATNNQILSGVGKILSLAEELTSVVAENSSLMTQLFDDTGKLSENIDDITKSADWITMIVKTVAIFIRQVIGAGEEAEARVQALKEAAIEAKSAMYDAELAGSESIFGTNFTKQIATAKNQIEELNRAMARTIAIGTTHGEGNIGQMFSSDYEYIMRGGSKSDSIANTQLTAITGWFSKYRFSLSDMAQRLGVDLFDAYGNVNMALIEAVENTYKLTDVSKEWLDKLKQDTEDYARAIEVVESAMEEIFGNVAADAADTLIDQWVEAGNAALDYSDILDSVAKSYAKMLIQSAILGDVFDPEHIKEMTAQFMNGNYENAMSMIADDMQKIAEMEPVFAEILESFEPYFTHEGAEGTLANGIKGITEDTANLLASYLNAIRADVSMMRLMAQRGWEDVASIRIALEEVPSLNNYIAQIAAHNANVDESTHQILLELQGVIVNEGSGRGFRSYPS